MKASQLEKLPRRTLADGRVVIEAATPLAWLTGLGGLDSWPETQALDLRSFCVDTMAVRFELDLIWLSRGGAVRRVDRHVPPRRVRFCLGARRVIECSAGQADAFIAAGIGAVD